MSTFALTCCKSGGCDASDKDDARPEALRIAPPPPPDRAPRWSRGGVVPATILRPACLGDCRSRDAQATSPAVADAVATIWCTPTQFGFNLSRSRFFCIFDAAAAAAVSPTVTPAEAARALDGGAPAPPPPPFLLLLLPSVWNPMYRSLV